MQNRHYSIEAGLLGAGVRKLAELTPQVHQGPHGHYQNRHSPSQQVPGILKSREEGTDITKGQKVWAYSTHLIR